MENLTQLTLKKSSTQFPLVSGRKFFLALNRLRVSETLLTKNSTDVELLLFHNSTPSIHNAIIWEWGYPLYKIKSYLRQ